VEFVAYETPQFHSEKNETVHVFMQSTFLPKFRFSQKWVEQRTTPRTSLRLFDLIAPIKRLPQSDFTRGIIA
jgi:hypothetical protein